MDGELTPKEPGRGITRTDLEQVIRRAVELYTHDADATERLSEAEVLRIASEIGLPQQHVRQALYELPVPGAEEEGRLGRWYGAAHVQGTRVVPTPPGPAMQRLEEYLVTREFLQILRRQGERAAFAPADDTISNVARAVRRPSGQWQIARSERVLVEVRPMSERDSHVRIDLDMSRQRDRALRGGLVAGAFIGVPVAALFAIPAGGLVFDLVGSGAAAVAAATTGVSALGASIAAGAAVGRARFRSRVEQARLEIAALLDRMEGGDRLDPPPAPWLRGLRSRIAGTLKPGPDGQ